MRKRRLSNRQKKICGDTILRSFLKRLALTLSRSLFFVCNFLGARFAGRYYRLPGDVIACRDGVAGGQHISPPTGALLRENRGRWYFQNANGHTFMGKSRPVAACFVFHRARFTLQVTTCLWSCSPSYLSCPSVSPYCSLSPASCTFRLSVRAS